MDSLMECVRQAIRSGMSIDRVDAEIIEPAQISRGAKGALFLLAFAALSPEQQRQVVQESLTMTREQVPALN
jgi:hypothetical protein